jgi:hypothetical protein
MTPTGKILWWNSGVPSISEMLPNKWLPPMNPAPCNPYRYTFFQMESSPLKAGRSWLFVGVVHNSFSGSYCNRVSACFLFNMIFHIRNVLSMGWQKMSSLTPSLSRIMKQSPLNIG